tara:strand:+ start:1128 stop:1967 length:840 start_codon:yes stop_codon:yes gene_type:complete
MNFKRCKVVILPTNNEAKLNKNGDLVKYNNLILGGLSGGKKDELRIVNNTLNTTHWKSQHLYILSDEEIQVGDWYYRDGESFVSKCDPVDDEDLKYIQTHSVFKKIIASTDPKLDLPKPSKAFIQKYVELGDIDEVMVEHIEETLKMVDPPSGWKYGFPKLYPLGHVTDVIKWMVEQGYPQAEVDLYGDQFRYRCSDYIIKSPKVSKNNTITIRSVEGNDQTLINHILKSACGYGMAETEKGKNEFIKCMNSIPSKYFEDFIYTLSRVAEKSGSDGFLK